MSKTDRILGGTSLKVTHYFVVNRVLSVSNSVSVMRCNVTERVLVTVMLYACMQEVLRSYLGPVTGCYG